MGKRKSSSPVAVDKKKRKPRPAVSGDKKIRKSSSPVAGDKKKRKPRSAVSGDKEKRKPLSDTSETLVSCKRRWGRKDKKTVVSEEEKGGFFACYLLTSLSPRHKGHTYIGFTVNPRRRIRQHNGEIGSGASRTKAKRPWEMVFCIYGFPTHVSALQFEWAWQHPKESLAVRDTAATFKSLSGLANKIKLGHTMLTLPSWHNLHLTVNFFSTKYTKHSAGCPSLPEHMRVQVSSMDELPCYTGTDHNNIFDDEGDRDDYEMCNNISREYRSLTEGSTTAKVDTCRDHWKSTEEPTHYQNGPLEYTGTRQSGDLLSSTEDHRQPLFTFTSPEQGSYPFSSFMFSALGTENRDVVASREENGVELNQPASNELQTPRAADTDQQQISKVEVIDLLSPSPDYNITFSRKKSKSSTVCPQMIDLTESPIFV